MQTPRALILASSTIQTRTGPVEGSGTVALRGHFCVLGLGGTILTRRAPGGSRTRGGSRERSSVDDRIAAAFEDGVASTNVADLIREAELASTAAGEASDAAPQRALSLRLVAGQWQHLARSQRTPRSTATAVWVSACKDLTRRSRLAADCDAAVVTRSRRTGRGLSAAC